MNLGRDIRMIERGRRRPSSHTTSARDGHFVPNPPWACRSLKQLKPATNLLWCEVHRVSTTRWTSCPGFIDAWPILNVHVEALDEADLARAVACDPRGGPSRPRRLLSPRRPRRSPVIAELDMALVMSVEQGFSAKVTSRDPIWKVAEVVQMARAAGNEAAHPVDGGIGPPRRRWPPPGPTCSSAATPCSRPTTRGRPLAP